MIDTIFSAIETKLKAHASFSGFSFFRFASDSNSSQQSKGSVPLLQLVWESDAAVKNPKRWMLDNQIKLALQACWVTSYPDIDAFGRITEQQTYRTAIYQALFPAPGEHDFLDNTNIANLSITLEPLILSGIERKKHNGIVADIKIQYFQGV